MTGPRRAGRAEANRRHILAVATRELSRKPDTSMDDIARAAGVVRRTVYGHFPSREALVEGITDEAAREAEEVLARAAEEAASPVEALAGSALATWAIGDRYRLLIALAQRDLGPEMRDHLSPARERLAALLEEGARRGVLAGHLPPRVLALALESLLVGLLQAVNEERWESADPAGDAARACLVAAGLPATEAVAAVVAARKGADRRDTG
jgi:AcrR family transcriptional regulator